MKEKLLIVEDEFIVANDLKIMLEKAGYSICGIAPSVPKALELIEIMQPAWVLLDIFLQGEKTGIDLAKRLRQLEIPFIYISANTNQSILEAAKATLPYGFLVKPFRENDLMVMLDIARYRHEQTLRYNRQENEIQLIQAISESNELRIEKLQKISLPLNTLLPFDFLWISKQGSKTSNKDCYVSRNSDGSFKVFDHEALLNEIATSERDFNYWNATPDPFALKKIFVDLDFRKLRLDSMKVKTLSDHFNLGSAVVTELKKSDDRFYFAFFSTSSDLYSSLHLNILSRETDTLTIILEHIICGHDAPLPLPQPTKITSAIPPAKLEVPTGYNGIIGESKLLKVAFRMMELVAGDDTSVLILGESGTGKEKIAHTIHNLSPRKLRPLVIVNCAALPLSLIESELFGHEKGSFTGANDKRIGKFELADGGTIFLDEIAELPLEAQVKLLRVLQEKEIERVGGNTSKKVDVRIIAATNRNLEKEVAEGRFRLDLYYRLNVFPIELPALRQRKEDISLLVEHFINKYKKPAGVTGISPVALEQLERYHWPGNIRELEHLIARTMLLTQGDTIKEVNLPLVVPSTENTAFGKLKTMEEMERDYILSVLKICQGRVSGPGGAAEILNIPPTTLQSKMKKHGIKNEYIN